MNFPDNLHIEDIYIYIYTHTHTIFTKKILFRKAFCLYSHDLLIS